MKLKIFQSGKGDCILINSDDKNILVDGGLSSSYTQHVAPLLNKIHLEKKAVDLLCVSHIDDDHIGGVLKLIEDLVDWRVHDFHSLNSKNPPKAPKSFRPPEIKEIWHNAFHAVAGKSIGDIENMLAAVSTILSSSDIKQDQDIGEMAFSKGQAIQLSSRLRPEQLNIPLNKKFGGKFAMARKSQSTIKIGNLKITLIAPFKNDLEALRKDWNDWLMNNQAAIEKIKNKVKADGKFLGTADDNDLSIFLALANVLGDRKKVTAPNLASIMFLVEEDSKTLLMTGDGHCDDIRKGLKAVNKLDESIGLHVDVLKVQHHGSENNTDAKFCKLISADNYIFCGNGTHDNPDLRVIELIVNSRIKDGPNKCITSKAGNSFTLWFNSNASITPQANKKHMRAIEEMATRFAKASSKVKFKFMPGNKSFFDLTV